MGCFNQVERAWAGMDTTGRGTCTTTQFSPITNMHCEYVTQMWEPNREGPCRTITSKLPSMLTLVAPLPRVSCVALRSAEGIGLTTARLN